MKELYKIILVDDEDEVRGRIPSKIGEESGFTVVGTTGNGYDALELIEKYSPQVVLTDIKMPYIDGIELASIIRRDYPMVRVGFITGYNDFDYAREAIRQNVRSYLTKPLTQEDIAAFLCNLKVELDREYEEKYNREQIRCRYEESVPLIIENYFVNYLLAGSRNKSEDMENLREYGVSLDDGSYAVLYFRVEPGPGTGSVIEHEKVKLNVRANFISILEKEELPHYNFLFDEGIVFLVKERGNLFCRSLDTVLFQIVKTSEHFLKVTVTIGVSALHKGFNELGSGYEEASRALSMSKLRGEGPILYFDQHAKPGEGSSRRYLTMEESDVKSLEHSLRFGSDQEIEQTLRKLQEKAAVFSGEGVDFRLYVLNMVNILTKYAASLGADVEQLIGEDILDFVRKLHSTGELFLWAHHFTSSLRQAGQRAKMNNAQRLLEKAIDLIEAQYTDWNLTMESVCDQEGISVSYLSHLFKKYRDTSFVRYLTMVRMERAKELLLSTGDRIVEVAGSCGYRDVYYFSHCFKKYSGFSPRKFREENS